MSALSYHNLKGASIGGPKILDGQEDFRRQVETLVHHAAERPIRWKDYRYTEACSWGA